MALDPTLNDLIRVFLGSAEVNAIVGDDGQAALLELVPERELHPHVVTVKGMKVKDGQHQGPVDCPDCTRGLTSRGDDLICIQLPRTIALKGGPGRIVACGERS